MTYTIEEVPPRGGESSRFAISTSPTDINIRPSANVNLCFARALEQRLAEAEPIQPPAKDIILRRVVRTGSGTYELADCRPLRIVPHATPTRPSRFTKQSTQGGALLDDLFLGGEAWRQARDSDVFAAARQLAEAEAFEGSDLRKLNELVQLAVLARAGVTRLAPWDLPL